MGGFFGVAGKSNCTLDLFYGVDYHSHLGTRRGGMATYGSQGFSTGHSQYRKLSIPYKIRAGCRRIKRKYRNRMYF